MLDNLEDRIRTELAAEALPTAPAVAIANAVRRYITEQAMAEPYDQDRTEREVQTTTYAGPELVAVALAIVALVLSLVGIVLAAVAL